MATTKERAPVVPGALFVLGRRIRRYFAPRSDAMAFAAVANSKSFSLMPPASWVDRESVTRL
jgi:hypothetical protein